MSLIIFKPSGKVEYQINNKIHPFNEFIYALVNKTVNNFDTYFNSSTINNKKFYNYVKDDIYVALYFDSITSIDIDKIKSTLVNIYKAFVKLQGDEKLPSFIDLQFNQLMKMKIEKEKEPLQKKEVAKKMRKWDDSGEIVESTNEALDFSTDKGEREVELNMENTFVKNNDMVLVNELNEILNESDDEDEIKTGFFSKFSSYFGSSIDIDTVSKKFLDHLISKNVAPKVAQNIISNMKVKLSNSKITEKLYKETLTSELTTILTPSASIDLLQAIKNKKEPYVISIVGVNGVGKSTNLGKLSYWFLQNNLKVLICASDTFRSGAIEQLNVHVKNLKKMNDTNIEIFQKGYGAGDYAINTAKSGIKYAAENGFDVVLIDTAGRTTKNQKLMNNLKKFGDIVDLVIMVTDALAGTDATTQLEGFKNLFKIDYILVSKVDTVGDLVGTIINLATATPILYLGVGQTYTDLKRLNVKQVVDMLMR